MSKDIIILTHMGVTIYTLFTLISLTKKCSKQETVITNLIEIITK